MKPKLVGLYSPTSRSGKSSVAYMMADPLYAAVYSFAEPLKEATVEVVKHFIGDASKVRRLLNSDEKDTFIVPGLGVTLRYVMQTLGTSWGRDTIHEDFWTLIAQKRATQGLKRYSVIFDDMRFPNEFDMIRNMGGTTISIVRPNNEGGDTSIGEGLLNRHEFDHTIINDGDLTKLGGAVGALVREHLAPQADAMEYQ